MPLPNSENVPPVFVHSDDDLQEVTHVGSSDNEIQILTDKINQHQKAASGFRLTRKTEPSLPEKTKNFLKLREKTRQQDPSKPTNILFKCDLFLQTNTGKKQGTRVPTQTRGFPFTDVCLNYPFKQLPDSGLFNRHCSESVISL